MRRVAGVLMAVSVASLAQGYSPVTVKWPGFIRGTVRLTGTIPTVDTIKIPYEQAGCGAEVPDDSVAVQPDGRLQGAIVFIEGIEEGRDSYRRSLNVDIKGCRMVPRMSSLTAGEELSIGHNEHGYRQVRAMFLPPSLQEPAMALLNAGLPEYSQRVKLRSSEPGWIVLRGEGAHGFMRGIVRVFPHPYHVVTGYDGTFDIKDVPPGVYTVRVWHERFGTAVKQFDVKAGYAARDDLELKAESFGPSPLTTEPAPER